MNSRAVRTIGVMLACLLVVGLFAALPSDAKDKTDKYLARFMTRPADTDTSSNIEVAISSWTSDEERQSLLNTLANDGSEALVKALQAAEDRGFVRTAAGRHTLRYCKKFEQDGVVTIIVGTDRPLGYREVTQGARSLQYNVSMIQLQKDTEGKWTGAFAPAEKLTWNEKTASFKAESWQTKPTRLVGIREIH